MVQVRSSWIRYKWPLLPVPTSTPSGSAARECGISSVDVHRVSISPVASTRRTAPLSADERADSEGRGEGDELGGGGPRLKLSVTVTSPPDAGVVAGWGAGAAGSDGGRPSSRSRPSMTAA